MKRRTFVATTASLGTVLVAGCSGGGGDDGGSSDDGGGGSGGGGSDGTGSFRLLVSDQPAAIGDFDSLNVSFETARVFRDDSDEAEEDDGEETATTEIATTETTANETTDVGGSEQPETETPSGSGQADEDEQEPEDDDGEDGFTEMNLEGTTVDLTEVVGEKAIGIFDGELSAGTYTKIELHAADVEGIVDGEEVAVMIPSGKLQIVKPFEVTAEESTDFVFDINVVKKGPNGYNLLPVISESGVSGKDVEVAEVDSEDDEEMGTPPDDNSTSNGGSGDDN